jgi:hypothetical protein
MAARRRFECVFFGFIPLPGNILLRPPWRINIQDISNALCDGIERPGRLVLPTCAFEIFDNATKHFCRIHV